MNRLSVRPKKKILIACVKAPIVGEVKTRFLPTLSSEEAAHLYKCFVHDTLTNMSKKSVDWQFVVGYQSHPRYPNLDWLKLKNSPEYFKHEGSNLRDRLIHAFGFYFGKGFQQIVIIGCDSPNLPASYIDQAFSTLDEADVVLGPAPGGRYCLVGLSRPCLKLFDDVIWSSDQVFERTVQNAHDQNYRLKVLSQQYYVETMDDVKVLQSDLEINPSSALVTHHYLQQISKQKPLFSVV